MNNKRKFVVSLSEGKIIGEYNVLFMQKSMHIHKCQKEIYGYAMSRRNWMKIADEFEDFTECLKKNCWRRANREIFAPIYYAKSKEIK